MDIQLFKIDVYCNLEYIAMKMGVTIIKPEWN